MIDRGKKDDMKKGLSTSSNHLISYPIPCFYKSFARWTCAVFCTMQGKWSIWLTACKIPWLWDSWVKEGLIASSGPCKETRAEIYSPVPDMSPTAVVPWQIPPTDLFPGILCILYFIGVQAVTPEYVLALNLWMRSSSHWSFSPLKQARVLPVHS